MKKISSADILAGSPTRQTKRILIAGGGSGGHVLAGVAVAEVWAREFGGPDSVLFVGAERGLEVKLVPAAGFPLELLLLGSLKRVSWNQRLQTLLRLPLAFLRSIGILRRYRPDVILGVGGYASGPIVFVARILNTIGLLKARLAILEQNTVPGFTNQILGKMVSTVFTAFPKVESHFPRRKVLWTGNPIRSAMKPLPPASRDPFTIFVFGGSQGARGINNLIIGALPLLQNKVHLNWIHQTGELDYEKVCAGYQKVGQKARIEKFIVDMPAAYRQASLVICRAGSSTLAELSAVARAAILIPLPTAADNHQAHNAELFEKSGAAREFLQSRSVLDFAELILHLVKNPAELTEMENRVPEFFRPRAAEDVARELMSPS